MFPSNLKHSVARDLHLSNSVDAASNERHVLCYMSEHETKKHFLVLFGNVFLNWAEAKNFVNKLHRHGILSLQFYRN